MIVVLGREERRKRPLLVRTCSLYVTVISSVVDVLHGGHHGGVGRIGGVRVRTIASRPALRAQVDGVLD